MTALPPLTLTPEARKAVAHALAFAYERIDICDQHGDEADAMESASRALCLLIDPMTLTRRDEPDNPDAAPVWATWGQLVAANDMTLDFGLIVPQLLEGESVPMGGGAAPRFLLSIPRDAQPGGRTADPMGYVPVHLAISPTQLCDLMITAIEGGSVGWCHLIEITGADGRPAKYSEDDTWAQEWKLTVHPFEDGPETVTRTQFLANLANAVNNAGNPNPAPDTPEGRTMDYVRRLLAGWLIEDNADAETADVILQMGTMGSHIYC
jgi:hypothetical protein